MIIHICYILFRRAKIYPNRKWKEVYNEVLEEMSYPSVITDFTNNTISSWQDKFDNNL